jgi:hypothetical protein
MGPSTGRTEPSTRSPAGVPGIPGCVGGFDSHRLHAQGRGSLLSWGSPRTRTQRPALPLAGARPARRGHRADPRESVPRPLAPPGRTSRRGGHPHPSGARCGGGTRSHPRAAFAVGATPLAQRMTQQPGRRSCPRSRRRAAPARARWAGRSCPAHRAEGQARSASPGCADRGGAHAVAREGRRPARRRVRSPVASDS